MKTINVVLAYRLEEELRRQIAGVSDLYKISDAAALFEAALPGGPQASHHDELDSLFKEAEVILLSRPPWPQNILSLTPKLKWVQYASTGLDSDEVKSLLEKDFIITNGRGTQNIPISEYVMTVMLMFAKRAPQCFANKLARRWQKIDFQELRGKTLGIVGLGSVGEDVAYLARAFGMRIVATRRSVAKKELSVMGVDAVYPRHDLPEMLGECDFVVITVALTDETIKMIGERELKAMKPGAYIINVSRGEAIDEAALIRALKKGWIAGAGLDVFEKEPLPKESELWGLPNVIISSHSSARGETRNARLTTLFCENLKRYVNGQPLINVIDKVRGY